MYFNDPEAMAEIVCMLISLHQNCKVNEFKLNQTWYDLGLNEFDKREVLFYIEREFLFEFSDQEIERFRNIEDVVNHLSKSFWIH